MKKSKANLLLYAFITINLLFIFLQIHKQSSLVKLYYEKQRLEKEKEQLIQKKNSLTQQLYELKDPNNIMKYCADKLNMKKVKLNQIKKITLNESNE